MVTTHGARSDPTDGRGRRELRDQWSSIETCHGVQAAAAPDSGPAERVPREVRHALANEHAIALGHVELLLDGGYGEVTAEQRGALEEVRSALRRAHHRLMLAGERPPATA